MTEEDKKIIENLTKGQLIRGLYSLSDFNQAASSINFLLRECDFGKSYNWIELRRFRCYETACIISFCRPFETSRASTTLGLKTFGIRLTQEESDLKEKVLFLRRKVIAHSDEEEMNYSLLYLEVPDDPTPNLPFLQFHESLHLNENDFESLHKLVRKIVDQITKVVLNKIKENPGIISDRKLPASWPNNNA